MSETCTDPRTGGHDDQGVAAFGWLPGPITALAADRTIAAEQKHWTGNKRHS